MKKTDSPVLVSSIYNRNRETREFYSNYTWCLNPILTFRDLLIHLEDEIGLFTRYPDDWRRNESKTNLYLFASAIDCTLTDYLTRRPHDLTSIAKRIPTVQKPVEFMTCVLNLPASFKNKPENKKLWELQAGWVKTVEQVCRLLVPVISGPGSKDMANEFPVPEKEIIRQCSLSVKRLKSANLPEDLLTARMKPNEGYRCQDLSWHDMGTLARRFAETVPDKNSRYIILGSRTAGSYLAPVLKVYLEYYGFSDVSWMTVRPKRGVFGIEKKRLQNLLSGITRVILIDDYANTGNTFHLLEKITRNFGIPSEHTVIMAPVHPVLAHRFDSGKQIDGVLKTGRHTKVLPLYQEDLYLKQIMEPNFAGPILRDLMTDENVEELSISDTRETALINESLWDHYPDSFQARLKRLYEVNLHKTNATTEIRKVLAKNVAPGWLGYHAYLAGTNLHGFVPKMIGQRNGLLFMEWVDGVPLTKNDVTDKVLQRLASYIAQRTKTLNLSEDPRSSQPYLSWGWLEILSIFRMAYHRFLGYLKYTDLLSNLQKALPSPPVLVDGRMQPDEWLLVDRETNDPNMDQNGERRLIKIDFEHHNFGAPELDVVDPAYDLAISSFEFELAEESEDRLISLYTELSGDKLALNERVFLYKLLYAKTVSDRSLHQLNQIQSKETKIRLDRRFQWSRDFRVFAMNKFCTSLLKNGKPAYNHPSIFFIDIDGILDVEIFGFPHTTFSGLEAVALLYSNGYSIIPNTGRSCIHMKNYCKYYGFAWAICEYGCVIVDMENDREISLIDDDTANELSRCRNILSNMKDVFVDSNYRYAIRAYRYNDKETVCLSADEVSAILKEYGLNRLRVVSREADTYFVGAGNNKGNAIDYCRHYIFPQELSTTAVGDSPDDVYMLEKINRAFAPSNACDEIYEMAKHGKCIVVSKKTQRGLLEIVHKIIASNDRQVRVTSANHSRRDWFMNNYDKHSFQKFMIRILSVAESSRFKRLIYILTKGL